MNVIGAGLAGLLAGVMLRSDLAAVWEAQNTVPNNHGAVLRFRSSVVGDTVGVPFKKVKVLKASHHYMNPVADAFWYSYKTNGTWAIRSSITATSELIERYIAPHDLISRMASHINGKLRLGARVNEGLFSDGNPIISTIPMPALMAQLRWRDIPKFRSVGNRVISFTVPGLDAYASLYVPDPDMTPTRISITGDKVIIEMPSEVSEEPLPIITDALSLIGIDPFKVDGTTIVKDETSSYAKILPIDEDVRKRFIVWASREHNIYSLGRYATWRPNLLLDDVVNDVRVIQRLAAGLPEYDQLKK